MKVLNKTIYKLEIESTKKLPIVIALMYIIHALLAYFGYDVVEFSVIGGMSLIPLLKLYLSSFAYKLCSHHRMFIYYIFSQITIQYIDYKMDGIPVSERSYLLINMFSFGIALILYIILKRRYDFSSKNHS